MLPGGPGVHSMQSRTQPFALHTDRPRTYPASRTWSEMLCTGAYKNSTIRHLPLPDPLIITSKTPYAMKCSAEAPVTWSCNGLTPCVW